MREEFKNGMPTKLLNFSFIQPDDTTNENFSLKASSRMIADRLYQEENDRAFKEVKSSTTNELLARIHDYFKVQDTLDSLLKIICSYQNELTKLGQVFLTTRKKETFFYVPHETQNVAQPLLNFLNFASQRIPPGCIVETVEPNHRFEKEEQRVTSALIKVNNQN